MSGGAKKLLHAAAGTLAASSGATFVDDVFNTTLFTGDGQDNRAFNIGLDLENEGGMVWTKTRVSGDHALFDTERGALQLFYTSGSNASGNTTSSLVSFDDDGFTLSSNTPVQVNNKSSVIWSFRQAPGFFECRKVNKSSGSDFTASFSDLGSIGWVMVKELGSGNWHVWCKGMTTTHGIQLNSEQAKYTSNYVTVSGTDVILKDGAWGSGESMIYAFADGTDSSAEVFGEDSDQAILKSGTFTQGTTSGTTAGNVTIDVGFEPQWLIYKNITSSGNWEIYDNKRTWTCSYHGAGEYPKSVRLRPDSDDAENNTGMVSLTSTGFTLHGGASTSSDVYIYLAMRRDMKEPTAGTDVFFADNGGNSSPAYVSGFPVDFGFSLGGNHGGTPYFTTRKTGTKLLSTLSNAAAANNNNYTVDFPNGMYDQSSTSGQVGIMFRRFPKVFDVQVVVSSSSSATNYPHNLGVAPEFFITKRVFGSGGWLLDQVGTYLLMSNAANAGSQYIVFENLTATTYGAKSGTFSNGETHLVLMWATLEGISKVGTYTGNGGTLNVNCGFSSTARFVLIKNNSATDDWHLFDHQSGINDGSNDPHHVLHSNAVHTTNQDLIDPHSSGFTVNADLSANGNTYTFVAIA